MTHSFWTGGSGALEAALRKEYEERLAQLRQRLQASEDLSQQEELKAEIKQVKADYKVELRKLDGYIY